MTQHALSPLMEQLMQISDMHDDLVEKLRRWQALWEQHLMGDLLLKSNLTEATTITTVGANILHSLERHRETIELVNRMYTHPQFSWINTMSKSTFYSYEIMAHLRLGDEICASETGYKLLRIGEEENGTNWGIHSLCLPLLLYLKVHKPHTDDDQATAELTSLAAEFVRAVDAGQLIVELPVIATYRQLDSLVSSGVNRYMAHVIPK